MRQYFDPPVRLNRGINGGFETFRGISETVIVSLGGLETPMHSSVHNTPNNDVVLGRALLMRVGASVDYNIEGSMVPTMNGNKGKILRMELTPKTAFYLINVDLPDESPDEARVSADSYRRIEEM